MELLRPKGLYQHLRLAIIFLNIAISSCLAKEAAKSRQKRILWITEDGRLALPPGTTLIISPSLSMPFVRYPPDGFFSNMTISLPFTIDFNKLGLTDNENPFGVLPPLLARSMGRAAGGLLADYIGSMLDRRRGKRSTVDQPPKQFSDAFHGGERALLYIAVEELLENFGMDGRACLLRAICEVHARPMTKFGLLGEMLKLFLSASKSPYADMLHEYVEAENAGTGTLDTPGECWPYMKDCPRSLFVSEHNHYKDDPEGNEIWDSAEEDLRKVTYNPLIRNM
ncbi:hypothetical protein NQ315_009879 [Exocentrus adspersus]|uniref:Uncharacterized protein n=1 Tax=Exocentrus adspersus TaxID=1586481 RepID=A0AAV8WHJ9_9CUCU|nr:hypothetical protein NQ315_009879 [Exocentrus adspersus]